MIKKMREQSAGAHLLGLEVLTTNRWPLWHRRRQHANISRLPGISTAGKQSSIAYGPQGVRQVTKPVDAAKSYYTLCRFLAAVAHC